MGLVRSALGHYCLGGAVPWSCVRDARGRSGGTGSVTVLSPPPLVSPSSLALPAVRVAGCPVGVSPHLDSRYAIPCGLCVRWAPSGCPSGPRRVSVACVCAGAPAV